MTTETISISTDEFRRILTQLQPDAAQRVMQAMADILTGEDMIRILVEEGRMPCCTTPKGAHESHTRSEICNCACHNED